MKEQKLFDKYLNGKHWENHPTSYSDTFSQFLKKNKFAGLLVDLGCGNGRDVKLFHDAGFDVIGIDNSNTEIESNKKKFPDLKFDIQNIENLSFKNSSVGAFFMINVIHYVENKKAISEITRTLKPGGYLFVHFNTEIKDTKGNVDYRQNQNEILSLVSDFDIIQKNILERLDTVPTQHKHEILELILQKRL